MHYDSDKSLNILMEKLRLKAGQFKSWNENAKVLRAALMDKRQIIGPPERESLQKCLDTLQKSIKVTTLQSMVERLESITRQQGLMFTSGPSGTDCFISSDMFYVEVLLELNGDVKDLKIAHQGEPDLVSCPHLADVLRNGNFKEFNNHLEGLVAIYQLNADKKQKSKAYLALKALETDLKTLSELQSSINEPNNLVHRSPVGILQDRIGGLPMRLTYFISPYDLLDVEAKQSIPFTVESVKSKSLGHFVTVGIESSTTHKLQTTSLMTISKVEGISLPQFAALSNLNSTTLPASFALQLPSPLPISIELMKKIQSVTGINSADFSKSESLLSLIAQQSSDGQMKPDKNKALFVTLPDQQHCYFMNSSGKLDGVLITSIPFVHPTHVPQILVFLRQQVLFNELIRSCIRTCSKQDLEAAHTFEIVALSWLHISISFEHPSEESMASADIDLSDVTNCKCKLYSLSENTICSDEYASKILQRSFSIPIMMRAILKKAQSLQMKNSSRVDPFYNAVSAGMNSSSRHRLFGANGPSNSAHGKFSFDDSVNGKNGGKMSNEMDFDCQTSDLSPQVGSNIANQILNRTDLLLPSSPSETPSVSSTQSISSASESSTKVPPIPNTLKNFPASLNPPKGEQKSVGTLMKMLNDTAQNQPVTMLLPKVRKQRKRKNESSQSKSPVGRSPKRKFGEDDLRDMRTPTPSSTPDYISSGCASPAGPYDSNSSFFPIKSSPSESPSHGRLTSPLDSVVKSEPYAQIQVRRAVVVPESVQASDPPSKPAEISPSPDFFANQTAKDVIESADSFESNISGYKTESGSVESEVSATASTSSKNSEKLKEKKLKKIKPESFTPEVKSNQVLDLQCSVAEQVAKLHGDSISPPPSTPPSSAGPAPISGSTSIKISTKDGKISTKLGEMKKPSKRSSSAGVDSEVRKKSDAKKEKKRKRAESADALEHKTSIKLLPLPSGIRVSQSGDKRSGDSTRLLSHGMKTSTLTSGSGSSQSKISLTPSMKKSPSHSSATSSPKNVSILKHSQSKSAQKMLSNRTLSSSKSSDSAKSLANKSLKFHSNNKSEKVNSEKLKLKQLSIPASTTITPVASSKSSTPTSQCITIVPSPAAESVKGPFSITTPPSMSITAINLGNSPSSPGGSSNNKVYPVASSKSSSSNGNNNNKSPVKPRKGSLSAVIDKLMVNATQPPNEKNEPTDRKNDKKESSKSTDSKKFNSDSKTSENKPEFTVKQSSQGIKLTVTKTRTSADGSSKVSKSKVPGKTSPWSSSGIQTAKSTSSKTSSQSSGSSLTSKKHSTFLSSNSKSVPKSSSSPLKITVASMSTSKTLLNSGKNVLSKVDTKTADSNEVNKAKILEDKVKSKIDIKSDKKERTESSVRENEIGSDKNPEISSNFDSKTGNKISEKLMSNTSENPVIIDDEITEITKQPLVSATNSIIMPLESSGSVPSTKPTRFPSFGSQDNRKMVLESSSTILESSKPVDVVVDLSKSPAQTQPLNKFKKKNSGSCKSDDDDEDGLFIDCPGTPRKPKPIGEESDQSNLQENSISNNQKSKPQGENSKIFPKEPSPPSSLKSPANVSTPHSEILSNPGSVSRPSPCVIDDDLMDEALMLGN